jgi:hypothetical protein
MSVTGCPHAVNAAFTARMKTVFSAVSSSSVEGRILAGDVDTVDVIVLPDARDAVLVKQIRLGQGGFIRGDDNGRRDALIRVTCSSGL